MSSDLLVHYACLCAVLLAPFAAEQRVVSE